MVEKDGTVCRYGLYRDNVLLDEIEFEFDATNYANSTVQALDYFYEPKFDAFIDNGEFQEFGYLFQDNAGHVYTIEKL